MPSSPEVATWKPDELRTGSAGTTPPGTGLALFEISTSAAVPDDLLAEARATARAEGYSAGWASGIRAATERAAADAEQRRAEAEQLIAHHREELRRGIAALDAAAAALERQSLPTVEQLETLLLESAFAVAEALVGHALRDEHVRAPAALARVLALAPDGEAVTVRLNPADHALLSADAGVATNREITLVADPELAPGDAVASAGATEIDARIRAGVARVRKVLAP